MTSALDDTRVAPSPGAEGPPLSLAPPLALVSSSATVPCATGGKRSGERSRQATNGESPSGTSGSVALELSRSLA